MIQLDRIKNEIENHIDGPIQNILGIDEGVMNFTYNIQTSTDEYILKVNPIGREYIASKESNAVQLCNIKGCKVPDVILSRKADQIIKNSFLLYKRLHGKSLSSCYNLLNQSDILKLSTQITNNFQCISSINLNSAGETVDFRQFENKSWKDFLKKECNTSFAFISKNKLFTEEQIDKLKVYIESQIMNLKFTDHYFVWADFDPSNIIIDDEYNLSGFIDFEGVIGGDPAYAIGCVLAKYGKNTLTKSLTEQLGYNSNLLDFYSIVRYFRLIKYSNFPLPTGKKHDDINYFLPYANHQIINIV